MEILEYVEEAVGPETTAGGAVAKAHETQLSTVGAAERGSSAEEREEVSKERMKASYRTLNRFILMNSNIYIRLVKALNAQAVPENLDNIFKLDPDDPDLVWTALTKLYHYAYPDKLDGKIYEDFEDFIIEMGHSLSNVDWMTTNNGKLHTYMDN